jgi:ketosteroid isomerase-like protein
MSTNPNLETLRRIYSSWSGTRGVSAEEIIALFDDEVEIVSARDGGMPDPVTGVRRGRAGAQACFEGPGQDWEMMDWEIEHYLDGGDVIAVVSRCAWRNRTSGRIVDTPRIDVHTFRDGRVVRFQEA